MRLNPKKKKIINTKNPPKKWVFYLHTNYKQVYFNCDQKEYKRTFNGCVD